jgi:hypothetical protein
MPTDDWYVEVNDALRHDSHFIKFDQLDDWIAKALDVEHYTSMFRYPTPDIHVGALLAGFGLDFDCADNPDKARKEAVAVIKFLMGKYGMTEHDFSIAFSGCKGFHVFINRHVLDIQPHAQLPAIFKDMAKELIVECGLKTLDLKIYISTALIRLLNSRHPVTGLYKIPLTYTELENLSIDKIKALATKKREITVNLKHEKNDRAAEWFEQTKTKYPKKLEKKRLEFTADDYQVGDVWPCVKGQLEAGARDGQRNAVSWQLETYFLKRGLSEQQCLEILKPWYEKCDQPPKAKYLMTWEDLEKTARATYAAGGYGIGCGSEFAEDHCVGKDKCPLFKLQMRERIFTPEILTKAGEALENDPLKQIVEAANEVHVGDQDLIKTAYISGLSAILAKPIHLWPIGTSQKGKSHALYEIIQIFPVETYEVFTSASPKSLFYYAKEHGPDAFDGKLIYIDEVESSKMTLPMLRSLTGQTDIAPRHLSCADNELIDILIKGKRTVWFTSVKAFGREQLRNRFIFTNPDETPKQDEDVHKFQLEDKEDRDPNNMESFQIAQAMTRQIINDTKALTVEIPYLEQIKWPFKDKRWLFPIFKRFIRAITKIHYTQREIKDNIITAAPVDFDITRTLWKTFQEHIIYRASTPALKILDQLDDKSNPKTVSQLSEDTGFSTMHVGRLLRELGESELVNRAKIAKSKAYWYWKSTLASIEDVTLESDVSNNKITSPDELSKNANSKLKPPSDCYYVTCPYCHASGKENHFNSQEDLDIHLSRVHSKGR